MTTPRKILTLKRKPVPEPVPVPEPAPLALTKQQKAELEAQRRKAEREKIKEANRQANEEAARVGQAMREAIEAYWVNNPVLKDYKPLAIGAGELIMDALKEVASRRLVRDSVKYHCKRIEYLRSLTHGGARFNPITGEPEGEISTLERETAKAELKQRMEVIKPTYPEYKPKKHKYKGKHKGKRKPKKGTTPNPEVTASSSQ